MESESGRESSNHLKTDPKATVDEGGLTLRKKLISSSSSSSSSSLDSSPEDFFDKYSSPKDIFQVGANEFSKLTTGTPKLDDDAQLASKDGEKVVPCNSSLKSEQNGHGPPGAIQPPEFSGFTPDLSLHNRSAMQSPSIQMMGRPGDSNSYRIPSSVFSRSKSTTPMEWSVASNESLFSIHVGMNSFSRDHVFLMGRSGELGKHGDLTKSGELINFPTSFPLATAAVDTEKKSTGSREGLGVTKVTAETMKEVLRATAEGSSKGKPPIEEVHHSSSISPPSDGSGRSFAFPILTGEGGRSGSGDSELQQSRPQSPTPKVAGTNELLHSPVNQSSASCDSRPSSDHHCLRRARSIWSHLDYNHHLLQRVCSSTAATSAAFPNHDPRSVKISVRFELRSSSLAVAPSLPATTSCELHHFSSADETTTPAAPAHRLAISLSIRPAPFDLFSPLR
ncbi:hypothetical protein HHK36_015468 [Tetracentron sinense]|uniref:Uncharacterized protein n=1 Tax=Tetracentron sinense TaxID=13715 RepID=A0A834Z274_TETSI|nr:hypothetical protein HHK36_015468 [Tetracentron sinense]